MLLSQLKETIWREFSFIRGNYRILVMSWMIMDIAMEMPQSNFQYYVEALGGTEITLGIIGFASFFAMAVVAFPGGYLADKYGRRWLISTMTFALALSYLFFAFAPTWHFILLGSIVGSLCLIYQPALFAMVQDSLPPERRGMGSSIIQLIHGTFNTPGPMIAIFLFFHFGKVDGMRIIYLFMTGLFLAAAVLRLRLKQTMRNTERFRFRYFISSYPKAIKESFRVWKVVPRTVLWLFSVRTLVMFSLAITMVINALYARDVLGLSEQQWWYVFIPLLLTMVVASIPIGKMVDKIGRKIPLILGLIVLSASTVIFVTGNFIMVLVSMCLLGFGRMLIMSSSMALNTDLVHQVNRGKVMGFNNFIGYIVMGSGMLLGSYLYGNIIPQLPFIISLGVSILTLPIVLFQVHEPKERIGITQNAKKLT